MHITNFKHFLNEEGNIPKDMPKEAREIANFLALLIDEGSTGDYDAEPTIRCKEKNCSGLIVPTIIEERDEIYWVCVECKTRGVISDWRGTKWDNGIESL